MTTTRSVTATVTPRLGPTPIQIPMLQTYILGDFMRAFGVDEQIIQTAQSGFMQGDFSGIRIRGVNAASAPVEQTTLMFKDVLRDRSISVDTSSATSITEQLSKRLAKAILYSATAMQRRGLAIRYTYLFTPQANANYQATLAKYGLVPGDPCEPAPGTALRDIYTLTHKPTGAVITHASTRTIK